MAAQLRFVKLHLNKPQDFWNNVLWTDQTKVEMFGHNAQQHVWRKPNTTYQHKHLKPTQAQWWRYDDLGSFCSHRTWTPCSHRVHHGLLCIPKYSRAECKAICPTADVWLNLCLKCVIFYWKPSCPLHPTVPYITTSFRTSL